MRQPIDLVGGFYTDDSLPWSCQDTVNYIPVAAEVAGTRTPAKLVDAPGLRPWVAIGNTDGNPTAGAPIRGLHDVEGRLFVVSGRMLYEISQEGVAIPRGTIPGVGRVSMAHNQRGHGHELLVVNGSGGYVYNTGSDTFSVVTDAGYPGAAVVDFLDGYLMQVEPFGRFLFHSDLADALEYNTLDRFEAETQPDRVVGMIVNHQEVWAFGDRTIDVFGNAGTAQGTFQNKGVSISRGCIAKWSPAIVDNGVAWLGDDRVVYHARGYDPARISTRAIEVALSECSLTDIRNAFSFVWSDRGHSVYYLTVPNGQTFGYDFSTGLWHRRASWHPERDIGGRWCLADLVRHNGRWVGGDFRDGRLYQLDWDYMLEGCEPLIRERVSPVIHGDGRRFTADSVELMYDTGGSESECFPFPVQPMGPTISGEAPDGELGQDYPGYAYTITPGDAALTRVEVVSGKTPTPLDSSGVLQPGPANPGAYTFTVRVIDANGLWGEHSDTVIVPIIVEPENSNSESMIATSLPVAFPEATDAGGRLLIQLCVGSPTAEIADIGGLEDWAILGVRTVVDLTFRSYQYLIAWKAVDPGESLTLTTSIPSSIVAQTWYLDPSIFNPGTPPECQLMEFVEDSGSLARPLPPVTPPWGGGNLIIAAYGGSYVDTLVVPRTWPYEFSRKHANGVVSGSYMTTCGSCSNLGDAATLAPPPYIMETDRLSATATIVVKLGGDDE